MLLPAPVGSTDSAAVYLPTLGIILELYASGGPLATPAATAQPGHAARSAHSGTAAAVPTTGISVSMYARSGVSGAIAPKWQRAFRRNAYSGPAPLPAPSSASILIASGTGQRPVLPEMRTRLPARICIKVTPHTTPPSIAQLFPIPTGRGPRDHNEACCVIEAFYAACITAALLDQSGLHVNDFVCIEDESVRPPNTHSVLQGRCMSLSQPSVLPVQSQDGAGRTFTLRVRDAQWYANEFKVHAAAGVREVPV